MSEKSWVWEATVHFSWLVKEADSILPWEQAGVGRRGMHLQVHHQLQRNPVISFPQMSWSSNTWPPDAKSWLIRKDPDAGKDWKQEEKGMTEGEMALLTQWTRVWANSWRWWRTGKPGMLQFMGWQRVRHYWATEQQLRVTSGYDVLHKSLADGRSKGFFLFN